MQNKEDWRSQFLQDVTDAMERARQRGALDEQLWMFLQLLGGPRPSLSEQDKQWARQRVKEYGEKKNTTP